MAGDEDQPLKAPEVGAAMAGVEDQPLKAPEAGAARVDDREEEEEDLEDHPARLPADVLADILRRVEPRWLAASRCVCKGWRDAVDGRRLLRADLLPLSLAGLFVHFDNHKFPEFLACPSSSAAGGRAVSGNLSFLPSASPHCGYFWQEGCVDFDDYNIEDHCNGLLLLRSYCVVNPATRQWNTLPTPPAKRGAESVRYRALLVYDPMTSTYFEVFRIPILDDIDPSMEESEWPPRLCKMNVFSSKSGCWEQKDFIREGGAAGTMGELGARYNQVTAAYFRGELYVHCETYFIMRVSLSNNTYCAIKPPTGLKVEDYETRIARSEKGVYFVALDDTWHPQDKSWLRVWTLNESFGQMEWKLMHDKELKHMLPRQCFCIQVKWTLEDINYNMFRASSSPDVNKKAATNEKFDWDSDKDVEEEDMVDHYDDLYREDIKILGFHPYKEIVFLSASERTCLAYHLNGSKIEALGNIYPEEYIYFKEVVNEREWITSFPYTPCWME